VHPHDAKSWNETTEKELRDLLAQPEVLAVGECGLDFDRNFSTPAQQEAAFEAQLRIARDVKKPLFLHERAAHAPFTEMLRAHMPHLPGGAIVHCFTGTWTEATTYVALGAYIGITGWVCDPRRGDALRRALRDGAIPAHRLMLETDGPFLTPSPARGRNEPSLLPLVLAGVATALQIPPAQLAATTTANARAVFRLPAA
jgi:TatD DNase family protein